MGTVGEPTWTVVLAVKPLAVGKSRLRGALDGVRHERLVMALTLDTVSAVLSCAEVGRAIVVTDDGVIAEAVRTIGAEPIPDRPRAGLNAAFAHGAALSNGWTAVLAADLPALRSTELAAVLCIAQGGPTARGRPSATRSFVADAAGCGTVLLAAPPGVLLDPRFGPESATAHAASGARRLAGCWPGLRRDVDTPADLAVAAELGLGRHTAELVCPSPAPTGR